MSRGIPCNGTRVVQLRRMRGLTQSQLAEICGLSIRTVSNAERSRMVDLPTLSRLALALNCTVGKLCHCEPDVGKRHMDLARQWHDHYVRQDVSHFIDLHHRDSVLLLPGSQGMSAGGCFHGTDGLRQHVEIAIDTVPVTEILSLPIDVVGPTVFCRPTVKMLSTKKGQSFTVTHVNELEIVAGKVIRRATYADFSLYRRHMLPVDSGIQSD